MKYTNIILGNHCTFQIYKGSISWDLYGTGVNITHDGWIKIFQYINSLPTEPFKISRRLNWFSFGQGYSYLTLDKKYVEENKLKIIQNFKDILTNCKYVTPPLSIDERLNKIIIKNDEKDDEKIWVKYKEQLEILREKYKYWIKKKKENSGYNRFRILERDNFKCKLCGRDPPEVSLHIDHWIPKAKGGLDIYENLVTLCSTCNLSKHATIPKNKIEDIISGEIRNDTRKI